MFHITMALFVQGLPTLLFCVFLKLGYCNCAYLLFLNLVFSDDALLARPQNVLWCCWPLLFDIFTSSYDTVHEDALQDLPIKSLARPGCLVVLWVTNNERLEEYSLHTLFPAWGLSAVARWHWIKVLGICYCVRSVCSFVQYKQRKVFFVFCLFF